MRTVKKVERSKNKINKELKKNTPIKNSSVKNSKDTKCYLLLESSAYCVNSDQDHKKLEQFEASVKLIKPFLMKYPTNYVYQLSTLSNQRICGQNNAFSQAKQQLLTQKLECKINDHSLHIEREPKVKSIESKITHCNNIPKLIFNQRQAQSSEVKRQIHLELHQIYPQEQKYRLIRHSVSSNTNLHQQPSQYPLSNENNENYSNQIQKSQSIHIKTSKTHLRYMQRAYQTDEKRNWRNKQLEKQQKYSHLLLEEEIKKEANYSNISLQSFAQENHVDYSYALQKQLRQAIQQQIFESKKLVLSIQRNFEISIRQFDEEINEQSLKLDLRYRDTTQPQKAADNQQEKDEASISQKLMRQRKRNQIDGIDYQRSMIQTSFTSLPMIKEFLLQFTVFLLENYQYSIFKSYDRPYGISCLDKLSQISKIGYVEQPQQNSIITIDMLVSYYKQFGQDTETIVQNCEQIHSFAIVEALNSEMNQFCYFFDQLGEIFPWKAVCNLQYEINEDNISPIVQQSAERLIKGCDQLLGIMPQGILSARVIKQLLIQNAKITEKSIFAAADSRFKEWNRQFINFDTSVLLDIATNIMTQQIVNFCEELLI